MGRLSKIISFPVDAKGTGPQEESGYRELIELLDAIVWRRDPQNFQFTFVSKQAETILGHPVERWLNEPNFWEKCIYPEDRNWAVSFCVNATKEKRAHQLEYRMIAADGRIVWLRDIVRVVLENNEPKEVVGVTIAISEHKEALAERKLAQTEERLRDLSGRLLHLQDEERRNIGRELHDATAQDLAALTTYLTLLDNSIPAGDRRRSYVLDSLHLAEKCTNDMRTLSYLLHPPLLGEGGLGAALPELTKGFSKRSGIRVDLDLPTNLDRLPEEAETALFRVVQESLNNVHRHSGSPTARIQLARRPNEVIVEVKDEGRGIDPGILDNIYKGSARLGVGLLGMRERLDQLGGRLDIISGDHCTTVRATLPLPGISKYDKSADPNCRRPRNAA